MEFIQKEYEECFKQLRFYDDRHFSLLKFAIAISSSVATAIFAIYKLFGSASPEFLLACVFVDLVIWIGIFLIFWMMVRNRLYYIFPAKQINAIRKYFIKKENPDFMNKNQMYVSADFLAFKKYSIQTLMLLGVLLLSTFYYIFCIGALCLYLKFNFVGTFIIAILLGVIFLVINIVIAKRYLQQKGNVKPDKAIID